MKSTPRLIATDESVVTPQCPTSEGLQHAMECTVWLDEHGFIQESDGPVEKMFGYWFEELKEQHISLLLPSLAHAQLLTQDRINPILHFRCHCSIPFRGVNRNGDEHKFAVLMNLLSNQLGQRLSMSIRYHLT